MLDYIKTNICDVDDFELLKSNQFRTVYLVNNKLVVMFSANAKLIFNWYMSNQGFAPATIFGYDECICYDYLVPSSEYLKKYHIIDLIKSYRPKLISISDSEYYDAIEEKYKAHCIKMDIVSQISNRPSKEGLYQLHGNMDFDHTIVFDSKLILLDPRPITGALLYDIMNMYLSSFEVINMFELEELARLVNVDVADVDYYFEIVLVSKLNKLYNNDIIMYKKYLKLLSVRWFRHFFLCYYLREGVFMNILDIKFLNKAKQEKSLRDYDAKYYLVINTASKCGLTPQFDGLEEINKEFKDKGLVTVGFPCDQFRDQEFDSAEKADEFCRLNYGVTFEIMDKVDVNGDNQAPLFAELKKQQGGLFGSKIKWNFTKFIVDSEGNVIKRFSPADKPVKIKKYLSNKF